MASSLVARYTRHQGAQGDDPGGSRSWEATAEKPHWDAAQQGAPGVAPTRRCASRRSIRCLAYFYIFNTKVSDEQKRQHLDVSTRLGQYLKKKQFHTKGSSTYQPACARQLNQFAFCAG